MSTRTRGGIAARFAKRAGVALCAVATTGMAAAPVSAQVGAELNDFFNDMGAAANATGPTAYQGQSAGYYSGGNIWTRFPQKSVNPVNLQLPSIKAGCGGIDVFSGSFSFINTDEIVAMLGAEGEELTSGPVVATVTKRVEDMLVNAPGVQSVTAIAGYSLLTSSLSPNNAFLFVSLEHWSERGSAELHVNNIIATANRQFAMEIPGALTFAFGPPAIPGLGTGSGFSLMLQDRGGNTPEYLADQARAFMAAARERPEIGHINSTFRANVPQILADVDMDMVLKMGVSPADVNTSLGAFLGGAYVNDFNRFGRLFKVYVQAEPEYRADPDDIRYFFVRGKEGQMVPLSALVATSATHGPEYTNRFNLFRSAELTGSPAPGYSSDQALDALEDVAAKTLPTDMAYSWNAMSYQERAAAGSGAMVFVLALVFVFLILAAQYESWSLPAGVLLGTPIAIFGAMAGLWISGLFLPGYQNNVFAQIGLVMLIGMAAKNAILIVEFAKMKSDQGSSILEAALSAAKDRFRPILMTAFSFILGVLPLLVASGAGAEARKVMGMTVFSGMLAATVLGVLIIPALYVLVETLSGRAKASSQAVSSETAEQGE